MCACQLGAGSAHRVRRLCSAWPRPRFRCHSSHCWLSVHPLIRHFVIRLLVHLCAQVVTFPQLFRLYIHMTGTLGSFVGLFILQSLLGGGRNWSACSPRSCALGYTEGKVCPGIKPRLKGRGGLHMGRCAGPQPPRSDSLEPSYCHTQQCCLDSGRVMPGEGLGGARVSGLGAAACSPRLGGLWGRANEALRLLPSPQSGRQTLLERLHYIPKQQDKTHHPNRRYRKDQNSAGFRLILQFRLLFILNCIWRVARIFSVPWASQVLSEKKKKYKD